jgi:hypothetical protein
MVILDRQYQRVSVFCWLAKNTCNLVYERGRIFMILNETYFEDKEFKKLSVAALRDFKWRAPEAVRKVKEIVNNKKKDTYDFENEDIKTVVNFMRKECYVNNLSLIDEIVRRGEYVLDLILPKLIRTLNEVYLDQAFLGIVGLNVNCEEYLLQHIEEVRSPSSLSTVCHILGIIGSEQCITVLEQKYEELRRMYPNETYDQGPLYGLWTLGERFGMINTDTNK